MWAVGLRYTKRGMTGTRVCFIVMTSIKLKLHKHDLGLLVKCVTSHSCHMIIILCCMSFDNRVYAAFGDGKKLGHSSYNGPCLI